MSSNKVVNIMTFGAAGLIKKAFSSPDTPPPPPRAPTFKDPAVERAAEDAKKRAAMSKGRGSTILTGGRGLLDDPVLKKKTLLGN